MLQNDAIREWRNATPLPSHILVLLYGYQLVRYLMTQSQIMCHVRGQNQRKIKVSNWAVWHSHRIHICMGSTYVEYFYKWSDFDHIIWNCFVLQYTYQIKIYKTCFHTLSLVWKTNWYWYWCFHLHLDQYKKVHMLVIMKYSSTEGWNISFYLP